MDVLSTEVRVLSGHVCGQRSQVLRAAIWFFHVILLVAVGTCHADTLRGRVIGITDGDTVRVLDSSNSEWNIRLMGIDAPEKKQPFGHMSKQSLSDLIFNKLVTVEYAKQDRYGRTIGKVSVNGVDANLEQVKRGMAWHYKRYQNEQTSEDQNLYANAEAAARSARLGLWRDPDPTAPWDWRKQ